MYLCVSFVMCDELMEFMCSVCYLLCVMCVSVHSVSASSQGWRQPPPTCSVGGMEPPCSVGGAPHPPVGVVASVADTTTCSDIHIFTCFAATLYIVWFLP
jgi:hypothetical protein